MTPWGELWAGLPKLVTPFLSIRLSGFAVAFLASILSYAGASRLQNRAEKRRRKAAGGAVLAEMILNAHRAIDAPSTTIRHDFVESVWVNQLPYLSMLLNWDDLHRVVSTYDAAARLNNNARDWDINEFQDWRKKDQFVTMAGDFLEAGEFISRKVLGRSDLRRCKKALQTEKERLKIFKEDVANDREWVNRTASP